MLMHYSSSQSQVKAVPVSNMKHYLALPKQRLSSGNHSANLTQDSTSMLHLSTMN